jgi:hypothetical protein
LPSGLNSIALAIRYMSEQKLFIKRLWAELLCILGLIPSRGKRLFFLPELSDQL